MIGQKMTNQQQWDIWLAAHALKKPDMLMKKVLFEFCRKMGITIDDEVFKLKRLPDRKSYAWSGTVRRFVCGYIVGGSDALYADGQTAIKLALLLPRLEVTVGPIKTASSRNDNAEFAKTKRDGIRATTEIWLGNKQREAYGRRNWSACK
jgi:hypothetical protein